MIQLPSDWLQMIRVGTQSRGLYLFLMNDANQYYIYYQPIDPALPVERLIDQLTLKLSPEALAGERARYVYRDLHEELMEPTDQNWRPGPLMGTDIVTLEQYRGMQNVKSALETPSPPKPDGFVAPEQPQ